MNVNRSIAARVRLVFLTTALLTLSPCCLLAEEERLSLDDFEWTLGEIRSQASVERERPGICITPSMGGENVEFKAEDGRTPFSIVGLTLKAKRDGNVTLVPELFLMRQGLTSHGICHGIRILEPARSPRAEAFFPPAKARVWPGHAGDRLRCRKGDRVVVELLFDHISDSNAELLAAAPMASFQKGQQDPVDAQDESAVPSEDAPGAASDVR